MVAAPTGKAEPAQRQRPNNTADPHMAAAPTGTAEPHMAAAPQQPGGAPHSGSASSDRNQTNQKQI